MGLSGRDVEFLSKHHMAAMITVTPAGVAKAARVGVGLVDGHLWSSGTRDRVRTARLRRDPRCTLFVFDGAYAFRTLETTVEILDGPDVPDLSVKMFGVIMGRPDGPFNWFDGRQLEPDEFRQVLADEGRILYQFDVQRSYGLG